MNELLKTFIYFDVKRLHNKKYISKYVKDEVKLQVFLFNRHNTSFSKFNLKFYKTSLYQFLHHNPHS